MTQFLLKSMFGISENMNPRLAQVMSAKIAAGAGGSGPLSVAGPLNAPPPARNAVSFGQVSGFSGTITSPNYPNNYDNNLDITTFITGLANQQVFLQVPGAERLKIRVKIRIIYIKFKIPCL
jgi:hypothetical protein